MGQRLNIEIVAGEKSLANSYYHWSAYTSSAAYLVKTILEEYDDIPAAEFKPNVITAVRLLEGTGAGINEWEKIEINKVNPAFLRNYKIRDSIDRNHGLIGITEEGKNDTRTWEEGRAMVDILNNMVLFNLYNTYTKEEYDEYYEEDTPWDEIPVIDFNGGEFTFAGFYEFENLMEIYPSGFKTFFGDEEVYINWIE